MVMGGGWVAVSSLQAHSHRGYQFQVPSQGLAEVFSTLAVQVTVQPPTHQMWRGLRRLQGRRPPPQMGTLGRDSLLAPAVGVGRQKRDFQVPSEGLSGVQSSFPEVQLKSK